MLAAGIAAAPAAELCEGCWEVGVRGGYLVPSTSAGTEAGFHAGVAGSFRFRPFWSVEFSLDRHAGSIEDGPEETFTFAAAAFTYTFRSTREQRTRPYALFSAGLIHDAVGPRATSAPTSSGPVAARSSPASDTGLVYGVGAGALTSLTGRIFLRYEVRWLSWSSFGIGQDAADALVAITLRLGP